MNNVLEWAKANIFIVVFIAVMLAAAIGLPIFSAKMNADVRKVVTERATSFSSLAQLEKGEVIPGHTGLPNQGTLRRYEEVAKVTADDAAAVQKAAIEHNQKGRGVLLSGLFPEPPAVLAQTLPKRFHEALVEGYGNLLAEIGAGMPPDLEALRRELEFSRNQFITQDLRKSTDEKLTPEEQIKLTERLSNHRLSLYLESAKRLGMYFSTDYLNIPPWNDTAPPSMAELFNWQWEFWITNDVLKALFEANRGERSVLSAPVKRINWITVRGLPGASDGARPAGGSSAVGGFSGGGMRGGPPPAPAGDASAASAEGAPMAAPPINVKAAAPRDFKQSLTGRVTNPLYDVVYVDLELIVDTGRLPKILDEIARYNFFTVISLRLSSVDTFVDVKDGFCSGSEPVSRIELTIETIWLRAWTQQFMPQQVKQALGMTAPAGAVPPQAPPENLDL